MKKIILLMAFFITTLFADMHWEDIFDAYDIAKDEKKTVMIMLSREDCPGCQYMKNIVFKNETVITQFNKRFLAVHLDIQHDFIPEYLSYFATPTLYFLTPEKKVLHKVVGAQKVKLFLKTLQSVKTQ